MAITDPVDTHGHDIGDALAQEPLLALDDDDGTVLVVTGEADTEVLTTDDAHNLVVGQKVRFSSLTGGTGLLASTDYWVKTVPSATTFTLATGPNLATTAAFSTDVTAGAIQAPMTLAQTAAEVNAQLVNAVG